MLDRASSFAEPQVVALLQDRFVPVVVDEWYEARRQDDGGELYRRIVFQREGMGPDRTTQGLYIATPDGALIQGWNNRNPGKLVRLLEQALAAPRPVAGDTAATDAAAAPKVDARFARTPPVDGLIVDVFARVLAAPWPQQADDWDRILRDATGRDHLWISAAEARELGAGRWPPALTTRLARFHLVDGTRGEPPMWRTDEVAEATIRLVRGDDGANAVTGDVRLATADQSRSFTAAIAGEVRVAAGKVTAFDLVARGTFAGHGTYTRNGAPPGPFTLGIAFRLAAPGVAASVPPQGARDLRDYLGR